MRLDGIEDLIKIKTDAFRFHDQLIDLIVQQAFLIAGAGARQFGHDGSDSGPDLEIPLVNQMLDDFMRGIGVNFEIGGERANGRKGLPGLKLAADKGFGGGEDHLIENGLAGPKRIQPQQRHSRNVTRRTRRVKRRKRDLFARGA